MTGFDLSAAHDIYVGPTGATKVYLGDDLIWEKLNYRYDIYHDVELPSDFTNGPIARGPYTVDAEDNITHTYCPIMNVIDLDLCGFDMNGNYITRFSQLLAFLKDMDNRLTDLENS